MDRMLVRVESAGSLRDETELSNRLRAHLRVHLGVNLEVEVVQPYELPRYELKSRRVFDHRTDNEETSATIESQ